MSIVLYWHPMSSATPIASALVELGIPHERIALDLKAGDQRVRNGLRHGWPRRKVHRQQPVLRLDDELSAHGLKNDLLPGVAEDVKENVR